MEAGAWEATVHGVAKSPTRLSDFTFTFFHFPVGTVVKHPPANGSDLGEACLIPGSGRSPGGGNRLQVSDIFISLKWQEETNYFFSLLYTLRG